MSVDHSESLARLGTESTDPPRSNEIIKLYCWFEAEKIHEPPLFRYFVPVLAVALT